MRVRSSITRLMPFVVFGFALSFGETQAHHSIAGAYDTGRQEMVEARVAEFQFVNPHPFLIVSVEGSRDVDGQWRLEMDNRRELSGIGITAETFRRGDRVVVTGNPSRTEPQRLYIRRLERLEDGLVYEQVGTRPRIGVSQ